jgi:hypothetical protein
MKFVATGVGSALAEHEPSENSKKARAALGLAKVVRDQSGMRGGLFVSRTEALRYAMFEADYCPQAIVMDGHRGSPVRERRQRLQYHPLWRCRLSPASSFAQVQRYGRRTGWASRMLADSCEKP